MLRHLKRALASNLQQVAVHPREADRLCRHGIDHVTLHRYLVWRRSVFLCIIGVTLASAVMNTVNDFYFPAEPVRQVMIRLDEDDQVAIPTPTPGRPFANSANRIMGVLNYVLPLSALAAALTWKQWRRSRRLILAGWLAGFLVPMVLAITPLSWWQSEPDNPAVDLIYNAVYGFQWLVQLLPAVLSLLPGMVQACLRLKTLLPESIIPGWILVAAAPFYSLILLVVWVAFCHLATNFFMVAGLLIWMAAPLVYVFNARVLTGPLVTPVQLERFRRVQLLCNLLTLLAMILLLVFLLRGELLGIHLIGIDAQTSLLRPWEVLQYLLEYWGRSLFITVLAADFFMRVNRSIWQSADDFADTPAAEEYARLMGQLKEAE